MKHRKNCVICSTPMNIYCKLSDEQQRKIIVHILGDLEAKGLVRRVT